MIAFLVSIPIFFRGAIRGKISSLGGGGGSPPPPPPPVASCLDYQCLHTCFFFSFNLPIKTSANLLSIVVAVYSADTTRPILFGNESNQFLNAICKMFENSKCVLVKLERFFSFVRFTWKSLINLWYQGIFVYVMTSNRTIKLNFIKKFKPQSSICSLVMSFWNDNIALLIKKQTCCVKGEHCIAVFKCFYCKQGIC